MGPVLQRICCVSDTILGSETGYSFHWERQQRNIKLRCYQDLKECNND